MRGDDPYQIRRSLVVLLIILYNLLFRCNSLIAYLFQWYLYLFKLHYRQLKQNNLKKQIFWFFAKVTSINLLYFAWF